MPHGPKTVSCLVLVSCSRSLYYTKKAYQSLWIFRTIIFFARLENQSEVAPAFLDPALSAKGTGQQCLREGHIPYVCSHEDSWRTVWRRPSQSSRYQEKTLLCFSPAPHPGPTKPQENASKGIWGSTSA